MPRKFFRAFFILRNIVFLFSALQKNLKTYTQCKTMIGKLSRGFIFSSGINGASIAIIP